MSQGGLSWAKSLPKHGWGWLSIDLSYCWGLNGFGLQNMLGGRGDVKGWGTEGRGSSGGGSIPNSAFYSGLSYKSEKRFLLQS